MKKDYLAFGFIMIVLMTASFVAGYILSPNYKSNTEIKRKITELEQTIVQQQISNSYIIKHLMNKAYKHAQ